jgi:hypothetical protein
MSSPTPSEQTSQQTSHKPANRYITWIVGLSPVVAIPSVVLLLLAVAKNWSFWVGIVPVSLGVGSVLVGFFGGMALAINRVNPWWLLITLATSAIGFFGLQGAAAIGMAHMH